MVFTKKEFGFYPQSLQIKAGPVTVSPLPDLERTASNVLASDRVEGNWYYASPQQVRDVMSGKIRERPYASRVFPLPKTHLIEHAAATSEDHLDFHLWALSFFFGMRLTATEAGFLDATPLKPRSLVDFVLLGSSLTGAVELADVFWKTNRAEPRHAQRFEAAVHALFLGQNPQNLEFERFVYFYTAIDACYALAEALNPPKKRPNHARRIEWMCRQFGVVTPAWGAEVAAIRNDTLHEALFMGAPLGFAVHRGSGTNRNLTLQMSALVCRLLVALIGGHDAAYVRSPVNTRAIHGLDLSASKEGNFR